MDKERRVREMIKEAREIAEEEIAFAREQGRTHVVINRMDNYKRQLRLCDALEAQERRIEELREALEHIANFDRSMDLQDGSISYSETMEFAFGLGAVQQHAKEALKALG